MLGDPAVQVSHTHSDLAGKTITEVSMPVAARFCVNSDKL